MTDHDLHKLTAAAIQLNRVTEMLSEDPDVPERADRMMESYTLNEAQLDLIDALVAEVRELRSLLSVAESGRKAERNLRLNAEEECGELRKDRALFDVWLDATGHTREWLMKIYGEIVYAAMAQENTDGE